MDGVSATLTRGDGCGIDKQKCACLQDKVRTTQSITTKLGSYIPLVMLITWLDFGGILLEPFSLPIFKKKIRMCFFKVKHSIGYISGMVGPIDVRRKGGASVGFWVNCVISIFDLTHDLELWFAKVKFHNSCISGIYMWLMRNKKKANVLDTGLTVWSCPLGVGVGGYRIMTGVTSDVCVPLIYLVQFGFRTSPFW